jgi:hypothetical protein
LLTFGDICQILPHYYFTSPFQCYTANGGGNLTKNSLVRKILPINELIAYVNHIDSYYNYSYVSRRVITHHIRTHHTFSSLTLEFRAHVGSVNEDFTRAGLRGVHLNNENIARYYYNLWPHIREIRRADFRGDHFNI